MEIETKIVPDCNYGSAIQLIWNLEVNSDRMPQNLNIYHDFEAFIIDEFIFQKGTFLGAYHNQKLVGVSGIKEDYLMFFYIEKEYQNQGIGKELIKKQIEIIEKTKISYLYLDAVPESYQFYLKNGFEVESKDLRSCGEIYRMKKLIRRS